jgi:glycosyltransferase involved in cell wall biosynthesis
MKILHVSHLYSPSIGGNQYHNQMMSEKLAQLGHEVHVFTSHALHINHFKVPDASLDALPEREMINGVHVHRFKIDYQFMDLAMQRSSLKVRGVYRLFKMATGEAFSLWEHGPVIWSMLKAIGRLRPDVIVATNCYSFTTFLCCLAKRYSRKIPLIIMPITHISDPWSRHPYVAKMYEQADLLIACTDFEKRHLSAQGCDPEKIVALPLGIEPDIFKGASGDAVRKKYALGPGPVTAYFGRKVAKKGIEPLIDAMGLVWQEFPDAQLVLAGQPDEVFSAVIQKHVGQYPAAQQARIISIDNFKEEDKGYFYQAVDVVAMPSNTDSFGIVYLEAWASGRPVVACSGTPQETIVEDGVDGLLVEYNNSRQLAQALIKLFKDEELRRRMGQKGKDNVRTKYHLDTYGKNLQALYARVVKK